MNYSKVMFEYLYRAVMNYIELRRGGRMRVKHDNKPWLRLEKYKGEFFQGEWPTLTELFNITVSEYPDNKCFTAFAPTQLGFTYAEAQQVILEVSNYLVKKGVKPGAKVAVTGKNSPEWAIAYLSILFAGASVVPIDYQLKVEEIDGLMKHSGVKLLFVDEERYDLQDAEGKLGLTEKISLSPEKENYILNIRDPEFTDRKMPSENDIAVILYTSGTTGNPKGVMLSHQNMVADCFLAQGIMNLYPSDVFYALLPIHHSYTMLAVFIEAISVGAEIVFGKKLIVKQILLELKEEKVTMFLGVPMLFNKLLKGLMNGIREKGVVIYGIIRFLMSISGLIKKTFGINPGKKMFKGLLAKLSLDTNRICISGGGPLPASTFKLFNQLGIDFVQGYGLTETSPIITLNPVYAYKEASVGKILPQTTMKILDPDERGIGEIAVKGPMVMQGYYKNKKATDEIMTADGWLKTGDAGYIDNEQYVYLTGRKKSLIVTEGGKNVFPEEIEDQFQLFEEIEQILVAGYLLDKKTKAEGIRTFIFPADTYVKSVKEKHGEQEAAAVIQARMEEIVSEINKKNVGYKHITKVTVVDKAMPMTSTKKIKRFEVMEEYKD
jgi:long-chain acyl-CoA synthetase